MTSCSERSEVSLSNGMALGVTVLLGQGGEDT